VKEIGAGNILGGHGVGPQWAHRLLVLKEQEVQGRLHNLPCQAPWRIQRGRRLRRAEDLLYTMLLRRGLLPEERKGGSSASITRFCFLSAAPGNAPTTSGLPPRVSRALFRSSSERSNHCQSLRSAKTPTALTLNSGAPTPACTLHAPTNDQRCVCSDKGLESPRLSSLRAPPSQGPCTRPHPGLGEHTRLGSGARVARGCCLLGIVHPWGSCVLCTSASRGVKSQVPTPNRAPRGD
jgi:hypothetical protein